MIHSHTELRFISEEIGYGLFATRPIPRGTITWTLCDLDSIFSPSQISALPAAYSEILRTYTYIMNDGNFVLCWDLGRFMNHSCNPSTVDVGQDFEVAVRDINPGKDLTCEYALLHLTETLRCRCSSPICRGIIGPEDIHDLWPEWDVAVEAVFPRIAEVQQPLWPFLRDQEQVMAMLDGKAKIPSNRPNRNLGRLVVPSTRRNLAEAEVTSRTFVGD